ncbi:tat pathway signal sequence [Phyllosticta citribraziliensis]|uniref:Tat pathway signal sequence n=1 Tax=Phyllosticta citribraziliensis TaxID=989973 RepID=A0ABR1LX82_9PEZI
MPGRYARLSTDEGKAEDHERLLSDAESSPEIQDRTKSWSLSSIVALWVVTFCFAGFVGAWIGIRQSKHSQSTQSTISKISQYSPIVDDVGVYFSTVRFNGSLMKENIFRQDASPEVDAAWESLGVNYRALVVPPEKAAKSNLLPDQVKVREKYGGGFVANVEGMHQLHCLNLLREGLYYNYDYYKAKGDGAWVNSDHVIRRHVSHCLDIIRQNLMCNVDIGVLGQVWVQFDDDDPFAYVDFNTKHTCRNFDQVREWAKEHQVPENVPDDFIQPPIDGDTIFDEMP